MRFAVCPSRMLGALLLVSLPALAAEQTVPVTSVPAADLWFHPERSAPAEVVPLNNARLSAEINARVLSIPVHVGQRVAAGETLLRLDCREYDSKLEAEHHTLRALSIRLTLARSQLQRAQNLRKERNISDEEFDRRKTDLLALEAESAAQHEDRAQAELDRERCTISAPFGAVVAERLASVGDLAAPGTPLLRLIQTDAVEVSARVRPEESVESAEAGNAAFSWLGARFPLALLRISPAVDPDTGTREIRFRFSGDAAPPGAAGRVYWLSTKAHLPADLLVRRGGRLGIFLDNGGHARFLAVDGAVEGQPAAVDLPPEARLIVEGRHALQDGVAVTAKSGD